MKKVISILLVVLMLVCVLTSCGEKRLVGTWIRTHSVLGVETEDIYVFNEDGTGKMTTLGGVEVDMTYTVEDGKIAITVNTLGTKTNLEYEYSFENGNLVLIVHGAEEEFVKQK